MITWIGEQQTDDSIHNPFVFSCGVQRVKANEKWQSPNLPDNSVESVSLRQAGELGNSQEIDCRQDLTRNYQKIGLKGSKSETPQTTV